MLTYNELIKKLKGKETQAIILVLLSSEKKWANIDIVKKAREEGLLQGKIESLRVMVSRTLTRLSKLGIVNVHKERSNNFYSIQSNAKEILLTLMAPYSDYAKFSQFDTDSIFHTWMGVTIYGITKETEQESKLEIMKAIFNLNRVASKLEVLKDKQRKKFLKNYILKTIKELKKNLKLKRFLEKNKNTFTRLMESKEALFMETIFSNNRNKYFKTFKDLNKKEKKKIKNVLEKGVLKSLNLYPDNISIAVHSSTTTRMPDKIHDIIYPLDQKSKDPKRRN